MHIDPLANFQEEVFANNNRLLHVAGGFPVGCVEIIFPVGSAHAHSDNGLIPGLPHFFEHMMFLRTQAHPNKNELERLIGLQAGKSNAHTYWYHTAYELDMPAASMEYGMNLLMERLRTPVFTEEDAELERGVVKNERDNRARFYPGSHPPSKYYFSEFLSDYSVSIEQRFGSDDDLAQMSPDLLAKAHQSLLARGGLTIVSVGNHNTEPLKAFLREISTAAPLLTLPETLAEFESPITWKDASYRTVPFDSVRMPTLETAWVFPGYLDYTERTKLSFVMRLLDNFVHGSFIEELRHNRGWMYGMDSHTDFRRGAANYGFSFPLQNEDQINFVREWMHEAIWGAVRDERLVLTEIERRKANFAYWYQTAGAVMEDAGGLLRTYERLYTAQDFFTTMDAMADASERERILTTYFTRSGFGEMAFLPE